MRKHVLGMSLAVVATVAAALGGAGAATAAPQSPTTPIPNSSPGWLAHGKGVTKGAAATGSVTARVYLAPNGGLAALQSFATAVSTPGSAQYGRFLTAAQYHARFDATAATVNSVTSWLTGAGLKAAVDPAHRYVDVTGGTAAANKAFGVTITKYTHDGLSVQAPSGAASAPASLSGEVIAVDGLDTTPTTVSPQTQKPAPPDGGYRNSPVCGTTYGAATPSNTKTPDGTVLPAFEGEEVAFSPCGYTGPQLRNAYEKGVASNLDGRGVTVAITDAYASPTVLADANTYAKQTGDQPFTTGQFTQSLPNAFTNVNSSNGKTQCGMPGWYGEETLDVEAVHAMAPAANVRYYAGKSCNDADLLDTFARINDENVADVVTNSWGGIGDATKPALLLAYDTLFLQGAAQGISYVFSSGDDGDEATNLGSPQTDYPASDPYVTAVGGTSTAITSTGITGETGWQTSKYALGSDGQWTLSTDFLYGGGGGYSSNIAEPQYQKDAGIQSPNGGRAVPDVSMDADPTTGMLIGQTQTFSGKAAYDTYRIGGTSLASPLFAGITALKIQAAGHGLGLLNPTIYGGKGAGFTDVTGAGMDKGAIRVDFTNGLDASGGYTYSVRTFNGATTSQRVGAGWDTETGWGSPRAGWVQ